MDGRASSGIEVSSRSICSHISGLLFFPIWWRTGMGFLNLLVSVTPPNLLTLWSWFRQAVSVSNSICEFGSVFACDFGFFLFIPIMPLRICKATWALHSKASNTSVTCLICRLSSRRLKPAKKCTRRHVRSWSSCLSWPRTAPFLRRWELAIAHGASVLTYNLSATTSFSTSTHAHTDGPWKRLFACACVMFVRCVQLMLSWLCCGGCGMRADWLWILSGPPVLVLCSEISLWSKVHFLATHFLSLSCLVNLFCTPIPFLDSGRCAVLRWHSCVACWLITSPMPVTSPMQLLRLCPVAIMAPTRLPRQVTPYCCTCWTSHHC